MVLEPALPATWAAVDAVGEDAVDEEHALDMLIAAIAAAASVQRCIRQHCQTVRTARMSPPLPTGSVVRTDVRSVSCSRTRTRGLLVQAGFVVKALVATIRVCVAPLLLSTVAMSSCAKSCDDFATAALNVEVVDESGAPVCDADVVANDGPDEFVLEALSGCTYAGAWERPGAYVVHVSRGGRSVDSEVIRVSSGACHVKPKRVELTLPA